MNKEKIMFSSATIELSEHKNYLELTNRLCYYDDKNYNSVCLPYKGVEDTALQFAKTLINMPVQAKYKKIKNLDDLGGHEVCLVGQEVVFNTESIGTHTDVYIQTDTVTTVMGETKELPCLYAKCRIWKRNKNIISAVKRLFNTDEGLNTSWEIEVTKYEYKSGVKTLIEYEFLGNAFLGSTTTPAYKGTSKTTELSAISQQELMIAEAMAADIDEEKKMAKKNKDNEVVETVVTEISEELQTDKVSTTTEADVENDTSKIEQTSEKKDDELDNELDDDGECKKKKCATEQSALTDYDLRSKLNEACRKKFGSWCWVSFVFPNEQVCWCEYESNTTLDYLLFTYSVDNDEVTVSDPEKVKLTVSISEINQALAERDESLLKANDKIQSLESEVSSLAPYREQAEQAAKEKAEAELKEKRENLASYAIKSKFISQQEIDTDKTIAKMISELDKDGVDKLIVQRLMSSLSSEPQSNIETSSKTKTQKTKESINLLDDSDSAKGVSVVSLFLNN